MRKNVVGVGELTEQVTLRRKTLTSDGAGGSTSADNDYATGVWAHIRPASGGQAEASMRIEGKGTFLVVLRNRTDMQEGDLIVWGTRVLRVRFFHSRGQRPLYLECDCEMGAAV